MSEQVVDQLLLIRDQLESIGETLKKIEKHLELLAAVQTN